MEEGLNTTLSFVYFNANQTAGDRIKMITEAEEGTFFQDEAGILRFYNRRHWRTSPNNASVWDIDPDDIVLWEDDENTKIYNNVTVKSEVREVQALQTVWTDPIEEVLAAGEVKTIWATLDDPISTLTAPVLTTDYTARSATGGGGSDIGSSLGVVATNFITTVKLVLTNNYAGTMYVNLLRFRGTPAIVVNNIDENYQDATSISKYNDQPLVIENNLITETSFGVYMAKAIVIKYKDPTRRAVVTIQGIPQLQLGDWVRLKDPKTNAYTDCRVMRIRGNLSDGLFTQSLTLREITTLETDAWAIVGITAVVGPLNRGLFLKYNNATVKCVRVLENAEYRGPSCRCQHRIPTPLRRLIPLKFLGIGARCNRKTGGKFQAR